MLMAAVFTVAGVTVILGARRMLRRQSYRWAIVASIVGQPAGLWALWVLFKPEVKDTFASDATGSFARR